MIRRIATGSSEVHLLIDGNNLAHRSFWSELSRIKRDSYYSIKTDRHNQQVGVISGVLDFIGQTIRDVDKINKICVFFDGEPVRRSSLFSDYKKGRSSEPVSINDIYHDKYEFVFDDGDVLNNQISALSKILGYLGCSVFYNENEEADDLIASYVNKSRHTNIIVSSDKDFFQLVGGKTVVYRFGHESPRIHDNDRVGSVMEKLTGVKVYPDNIRMFRALTGDQSDNIKGIFRLRKKIAAELSKFKTVDEIINSDLSFLYHSEKKTLLESVDSLKLNFELVGLYNNIELSEYTNDKIDFDAARKFLRKHNIEENLTDSFRIEKEDFHFNPIPDFLRDI